MKKFLIQSSLRLLGYLPLIWIRGLGSFIGLVSLRFSSKSAQRLKDNLLLTKLANEQNIDEMMKNTAKSLGMTFIEALLIAWTKNINRINKLFTVDDSFYQAKYLLSNGHAVVFLTPHIGNFEVAVKYFAYNLPMQIKILYKPSKNQLFDAIMYDGRSEKNIEPVPTTKQGVLRLIKHLKSGGAIGLLPDNVASGGDGEWVKFFNQNIYATSLAAKICQIPEVSVFIVQNLRTKKGFKSRLILFKPKSQITREIMQELYLNLEKLVKEAPNEYYWTYDRFRIPGNAKPLIKE